LRDGMPASSDKPPSRPTRVLKAPHWRAFHLGGFHLNSTHEFAAPESNPMGTTYCFAVRHRWWIVVVLASRMERSRRERYMIGLLIYGARLHSRLCRMRLSVRGSMTAQFLSMTRQSFFYLVEAHSLIERANAVLPHCETLGHRSVNSRDGHRRFHRSNRTASERASPNSDRDGYSYSRSAGVSAVLIAQGVNAVAIIDLLTQD
jgi:hypothetical protein